VNEISFDGCCDIHGESPVMVDLFTASLFRVRYVIATARQRLHVAVATVAMTTAVRRQELGV